MNLSENSCYTARTNLDQQITRLRSNRASFNVHYWGATRHHYDNPVHKHSFFEICYVVDGEGTYQDHGIDYPLRSGVIFCSRPDISHQIRSKDGLYLLFVAFEMEESECTEETIQQFHRLKHKETFLIDDAHGTPTALIWRALITQASQKFSLNDGLQHLSHALLWSFVPLFKAHNEVAQKRLPQTAKTLYQAKLFIRDNLTQPLSLETVADYLHISARHLSRIFSAETGETFKNYVKKERINQASNMLLSTEYPIKYIAEATGFNSVHYFTRVFTRETGKSPALFRKESI
ncbi:AraC family transcriptional regulator [Scopulibacillus darangshiensis]|nr:AraC family transcriptional regulator [Scopulibacillus darangshiensis]